MSYNKNVVEEALFQIKNLEETLQENAKGILQSTMSEEIKQLVKESLKEQDEPGVDDQGNPDDDAVADDDFADDDDVMDDDEFAMDDDEFAMDDDEIAIDDDETIDLTGASDDEVLRVFKAMGDEDGIIVKKEGDNIHLKDGEDEYMIHLGESDMYEMDIDAENYMNMEEDMEMDFEGEETIYEIEMDSYGMNEDEDMYGDADVDLQGDLYEMGDDDSDMVFEIEMGDEGDDDFGYSDLEEDMYGGGKDEFKRNHGHKMGDVGGGKYGKGGHYKDYEMEEDMNYEMYEDMDSEGDELESVMEAVKKSLNKSSKVKGVGIGHGPKFKYGKTTDYPTKKQKPAFGKDGVKAKGTGKARFEYKEGDKMEMKKVETKEAVRTNSYTRANKVGNRKGSDQNVNRREIRKRPNTGVNEQVEMLRERNEEYKKALDVFRTKLNEVAIFNSNLAYATRLFTEHSTTKQEKINILRRFDNVESLKESKNLYRTIKSELGTGSLSEQKINESIERTVNRTVETGSSVNLIESKTYENPQFLRMKDLMSKI
jgi:hypothetical protein